MGIIEDIRLALGVTPRPILYYAVTDLCKRGEVYYRESTKHFPQYVVLHPDDFDEFKRRIQSETNKLLVPMKNYRGKPVVYTLSVIDDDKVLVASREIALVEDLDRIRVGEGIRQEAIGFSVKRDGYWRLPDGREFRLNACAVVPTDQVDKDEAIWVWERMT